MAIYRGTGSASTTSDQATIDEVTTQATNAANSATSAASSASSAASSASSATSSASTATSQASAASTSATQAASSASAASTSASNASTSETNAATSATTASSSATAATTARTAAEAAQVAAETAETNAETAQAAAETAEANVSATINAAVATATADAEAAQTAAETAATNSATSATASATSATNAANSATASANSATASANSATAAQTAQTNAETAETNAEAALDEFTDLYLGVKSSAPTLDNDGDLLQTGALYYDSTAEQLYIWDGSAWDQAAFSVSGAVTSFNTRTGAVTLSSGDVTTALGYTPYNSTNPNNYVVQSDIDTSIANLVDSAPTTLDTLNELAAALGDDANFSTTVTNSLATKAPLASPALTGTPTAPTATANTNTTQLATTAYVQGELANEANWNTAYGWGDHGVEGYLTGNQTITLSGDVSGSGTTSISVTVADDSHNHVISNIDNLQTTLDGKVDASGDTMTGNLSFGDNDKAIFGAGSDLQIYHDGSNSIIADTGAGGLQIRASANLQLQDSDGYLYVNCIDGGNGGTTKLYNLNQEKLATTATGIDVTGTVTADGVKLGDNEKAQFGASNDLEIYHDGSNSFIVDTGTGGLQLRGSTFVALQGTNGENGVLVTENGSAQLRFNNSPKLETTSYGVDISGSVVADTHNVSSASGAYVQNFDTYQHFKYEMSGNVTLNNPTTEKAGQSGHMIFIQDATGGRTLSLGTDYETVGGAGITLSSAANATDIVPYVVLSSGRILLGTPQLAFS